LKKIADKEQIQWDKLKHMPIGSVAEIFENSERKKHLAKRQAKQHSEALEPLADSESESETSELDEINPLLAAYIDAHKTGKEFDFDKVNGEINSQVESELTYPSDLVSQEGNASEVQITASESVYGIQQTLASESSALFARASLAELEKEQAVLSESQRLASESATEDSLMAREALQLSDSERVFQSEGASEAASESLSEEIFESESDFEEVASESAFNAASMMDSQLESTEDYRFTSESTAMAFSESSVIADSESLVFSESVAHVQSESLSLVDFTRYSESLEQSEETSTATSLADSTSFYEVASQEVLVSESEVNRLESESLELIERESEIERNVKQAAEQASLVILAETLKVASESQAVASSESLVVYETESNQTFRSESVASESASMSMAQMSTEQSEKLILSEKESEIASDLAEASDSEFQVEIVAESQRNLLSLSESESVEVASSQSVELFTSHSIAASVSESLEGVESEEASANALEVEDQSPIDSESTAVDNHTETPIKDSGTPTALPDGKPLVTVATANQVFDQENTIYQQSKGQPVTGKSKSNDNQLEKKKQTTSAEQAVTSVQPQESGVQAEKIVAKTKRKFHPILIAAAVVIILGGGGGAFYAHQQSVKKEQTAQLVKKQESANEQITTALNAFYTDANHHFLKADQTAAKLASYKTDLAKLKGTTHYAKLQQTYQDIATKLTDEKKVNALFTKPVIVAGKATSDAILKQDQVVNTTLSSQDSTFTKLLNSSIAVAKTQYNDLQSAKQAVATLVDGETVKADVTRESYNKAKTQVDKVKNTDLSQTLTAKLATVNSKLTADEKTAAEKAAAEKAAAEKAAKEKAAEAAAAAKITSSTASSTSSSSATATSKSSANQPVKAVNAAQVADSSNAAWSWASGIKEKVLQTCLSRGYIVEGGYTLEPASIENGEGYYNLYATNNKSKLTSGIAASGLPFYIVSINCKTGYFVGNGPN
jgi:hypothetical protein